MVMSSKQLALGSGTWRRGLGEGLEWPVISLPKSTRGFLLVATICDALGDLFSSPQSHTLTQTPEDMRPQVTKWKGHQAAT